MSLVARSFPGAKAPLSMSNSHPMVARTCRFSCSIFSLCYWHLSVGGISSPLTSIQPNMARKDIAVDKRIQTVLGSLHITPDLSNTVDSRQSLPLAYGISCTIVSRCLPI